MARQDDEPMGEGMDQSGMRLQSYLSRSGIASRRACAQLVADGRAAINGSIVYEASARVEAGDTVTFDGAPVHLPETHVYYVLNKPPGFLCAMSDEYERPLAVDLLMQDVPELAGKRVYNVGRLDFRSSGLLLFTDDGEFARVVGHPSAGIEKEYWVRIGAEVDEFELDRFCQGQEIDGVKFSVKSILPCGFLQYKITLVEGKNREIRRIFEHLDTRVRQLRRIRIGPIQIEGLEEGSSRELTTVEISTLIGD